MGLNSRKWRSSSAGIAVAGALAHLVLRVLSLTTRKRFVGEAELFSRFAAGERVILAFWHGRMLMMPFAYRGTGACIMNSQHRDGEIISRAIRRFGIDVVRGSSTRGWVGGLKGLLAAHRQGLDLVVVPDGPRGPRCRAKSGVVQLARATGVPIYPVAFGASRGRVLQRSWDWMLVPAPFSRVVYVVGEPLRIEREAGAERAEEVRLLLEQRLNDAVRQADRTAGVALSRTAEYIGAGPGAGGTSSGPGPSERKPPREREVVGSGEDAPHIGKESRRMKRTSILCVAVCSAVLMTSARGWAEDAPANDAGAAAAEAPKTAAADPAAAPDPTGAAKRFESFSATWMDKLEAREKNNLDKIKWKKEGDVVVGEYVAYDTTAPAREVTHNDGKEVPIGKVIYIEQKLRLSGSTETEALAKKPEVVDVTEVTEIFQFRKGDWIY